MSDSLRSHELQHTRPPSPSPIPRAYRNSCWLSWWCHPTISSSVVPFSSCPQSFPASGLFQWVSSSHEVAKEYSGLISFRKSTMEVQFSSVQSLSHVWLFATPWTAECQAPQSSNISWSLLKFMSIENVMLCNHLTLCSPLLLLPSIYPSIRVFSNGLVLHKRWPKYWSFMPSPIYK